MTTTPSKDAVLALRKLIDDADKEGYIDELWALMTALRGPDNEDFDTKLKTTGFVRGFVIHSGTMAYPAMVRHEPNTPRNSYNKTKLEVPEINTYDNEHFHSHYMNAVHVINNALALGIPDGLEDSKKAS